MKSNGRILFVDDEPALLGLLELVSKRLGAQWEAAFADGGNKALQLIEQQPFDVVVSDMRMPGMNGVELLSEVMRRRPQTSRIVLSGYADQQMVLKCLGAAHQYLTKPFDVHTLHSTIQRLLGLEKLLATDRFRLIAANIQSLPSLPSLYFKLMEELASPDATTDSVGDLIAQDISLTAKLLQLVNSAFFGVAQHVATTQEAVQILGFGMVRTLSLSIYVFSRFDPDRMPGFPLERLWKHSMATGMLARKVATQAGASPQTVETAFTAGILHDIGKVVLGFSLPQLYRMAVEKATAERISQHEAETAVLGASHPEVGGYLLGLWGLPAELVDAVAWHHEPGRREPQKFDAVTAVHVANHVHASRTPDNEPALPSPLDEEHLKALGLSSEVRSWIESVD